MTKYRCTACEDWGTTVEGAPCPAEGCPVAAERRAVEAATEPAPIPAAPGVTYPLVSPEQQHDSRFTVGLVADVAKVLKAHGYPPVTSGTDAIELQQALYRFLYVDYEFRSPGPVTGAAVEPAGPPIHYAHAMTGEGAEIPRCDPLAPGPVRLFADNVTCPRCLSLLAEQEGEALRAEAAARADALAGITVEPRATAAA